MPLDISKIIQMNFGDDQYFRTVENKTQIYLHHTAGGPSAINTAKGWQTDNSHVATAFVIAGNVKSQNEKDGDIIQCFGSKYWAYHLGVKAEMFSEMKLPYLKLDSTSVAIEVCNWGQLTKQTNGTFLNYLNRVVPPEEVTTLSQPFKGFTYYHRYTDAQIASLRDLLTYLCDKYQISKAFNPDIFDITQRAFKGENGILTHNSVRHDKWDIYPCPRMIGMLSSL
jgi:N-acetyl-anhydromuramyl-L-alanine amidase AmpD